MEGDPVAFSDAQSGEPAGQLRHLVDQLAVAEITTVVLDRRTIGVGLGVAEHEREKVAAHRTGVRGVHHRPVSLSSRVQRPWATREGRRTECDSILPIRKCFRQVPCKTKSRRSTVVNGPNVACLHPITSSLYCCFSLVLKLFSFCFYGNGEEGAAVHMMWSRPTSSTTSPVRYPRRARADWSGRS